MAKSCELLNYQDLNMKTISDRIFEKLKEKGMSQKEFSQKTGIAESSISDWKKKHTNPVSDKILIICEVLDISPYELLSGAEHIGTRSRDNQTYVFAKDTELGMVVETYQQLDYEQQKRLLGYMDALKMNNQKNCNFVPYNTQKRINSYKRGWDIYSNEEYWVWLSRCKGIGPVTANKLLDEFITARIYMMHQLMKLLLFRNFRATCYEDDGRQIVR